MNAAAINNFNQSPDDIKNTINSPTNNMPGPFNLTFMYIFLLGVISCKWCINHNKKRIRVYLPESKRYLAQALKLEWGGTISYVKRDKHRGVMWQITSTRSLKRIKEAAKDVKPWLPPEFYKQLTSFLQNYI